MTLTTSQLWDRFRKSYAEFPSIGLSIDVSRMNCPENYVESLKPKWRSAFEAMEALEAGAVANPDEGRQVGHYWLRNPEIAPQELRSQITEMNRDVKSFAAKVHAGDISGFNGKFINILVIGIGGSALGPQFIAHALGRHTSDRMRPHFLDNTDPDGIDRVLAQLRDSLGETLTVVISKSGSTKETQNGMVEVKRSYGQAGLDFTRHAVAITGVGSKLDKMAEEERWIHRFPMWDWVGGRTSVTSAVGLVPASLQGIDTDNLLAGARACDQVTRVWDYRSNPAAQLATMWHYAGAGKGLRDMVIIPYKDRLELFSKYLQQLVMESLGKEVFIDGQWIHQGIAVYGNKGSTDQHAYIQQLRDGINNFFVTFIRVLKERAGNPILVEDNVTSGDYLDGFLFGTRKALFEKGRESITLTIPEVTPFTVGTLIALYERAVGFYASLVGINAYHQPGVEAGKKAAGTILEAQGKIVDFISRNHGNHEVGEIAAGIGMGNDPETVFHILEHLASNPGRGVAKSPEGSGIAARYGAG